MILGRKGGDGEGTKEKETEKKEKRETVKKMYQSVASHTSPDWGSNPQPRYVP